MCNAMRRVRADEGEDVGKVGIAHVLKRVRRHIFGHARSIGPEAMADRLIEILIGKCRRKSRQVERPDSEIRNERPFEIRPVTIGASERVRKTIAACDRSSAR